MGVNYKMKGGKNCPQNVERRKTKLKGKCSCLHIIGHKNCSGKEHGVAKIHHILEGDFPYITYDMYIVRAARLQNRIFVWLVILSAS